MTSKIIRACCISAVPVLACAFALQPISAQGDQGYGDDWPTAPAVPAGDDTVDAGISAAELRGHVQALSHDSLAGRPMGSDESLVAAKYVAERLMAMGVQPGAADGSYFQRIEFFQETYEAPSELRVVAKNGEETTLYYGEGFTFKAASAAQETQVLRCVTVAEAEDLPARADASVALVFKTSAGKARKWLEAAGTPGGAGYGLVVYSRKNSKVGERETKRSRGARQKPAVATPVTANIRGDWSKLAYEGEWASVQFVPNGVSESSFDVNVLGKIPGVGTAEAPGLKDEVVLLCAHRDHVGLKRLRPGQEPLEDMIQNGADDDASGCSVVLEVLETLAKGPAPVRSVVGTFVTGEEKGMVGSKYWAASPTEAPENVVCALNFEMLGRPDPLAGGAGHIWLTGDERSNLGPMLRERGLQVTADVRPTQNFFVRSDNVSFARIGIVSQTLSSYGMHGDYHQPTDEWDTLDYDHMEAAAAISLAAVQDLLSGAWTPAWNEGEPKF